MYAAIARRFGGIRGYLISTEQKIKDESAPEVLHDELNIRGMFNLYQEQNEK